MKYLLILLFALFAETVKAETLPTLTAAKAITDKAMTMIAGNDLEGGLKLLKPYLVIPAAEFDVMLGQATMQQPAISQRFGKSVGKEFIREDMVGDSLVRFIFTQKFEKTVVRWLFFYYKSPSGWVLNTFTYDDSFQLLFPIGG
ncbi:hypothetical protein [Thiobacillus sp.]|uniref:hypothetical protein n=1 Tax=Thiobacillus sp. TaxID=924 RepID=UPI00286D914A|nr:hypothetical protein [Thiobacillus sp.]